MASTLNNPPLPTKASADPGLAAATAEGCALYLSGQGGGCVQGLRERSGKARSSRTEGGRQDLQKGDLHTGSGEDWGQAQSLGHQCGLWGHRWGER